MSPEYSAQFLLTLGGMMLLGLVTMLIANLTFLPRVTILLLFGAIIGPEVLDVVPPVFRDNFEIIADMTLLMVGFLLGGKLTSKNLSNSVRSVVWISVAAAVFTSVVVGISLYIVGLSLQIAIITGCISSATAPAAILDVVTESNYKGKFCDLLLSITALDDIWALMLFAVGMVTVASLNGYAGDSFFFVEAAKEIFGALALGLLIGFPAAYLTGRLKQGQPVLIEALGVVFFCGGLAKTWGVSYLIAAMTMGCIIANFAKHHEYPFYAIEDIEWPFMVIFFVLAGSLLEFDALHAIGLTGTIYLISRSFGKYAGAAVGAYISQSDQAVRQWLGIALLPQAGVAIGMALVASSEFPEYRQVLLSLVISSTVIFEIVGPVFTRLAIKQAYSKQNRSP